MAGVHQATAGGNPTKLLNLSSVSWRRCSHSNLSTGRCLEFAPNLPTLGALLFTTASWNTFVDSVKEPAPTR
ncbi:DUF397 domain-containing protein [Streptomyces roseirectus]|uniref:DUF397 domain-containing protein n=1 Tax=Streptomyces roseirectus TaxID=2768066 RepID=A0A7H0IT35_9ACTN|nr:DUF397 domain-containing protein [Streptomyces roseirectus]